MLHDLTDIYVDLQINDRRMWNRRNKNAEKKRKKLVFSFRPGEVVIKDRVTRKVICTITLDLEDSSGEKETRLYINRPIDSISDLEVGHIILGEKQNG